MIKVKKMPGKIAGYISEFNAENIHVSCDNT